MARRSRLHRSQRHGRARFPSTSGQEELGTDMTRNLQAAAAAGVALGLIATVGAQQKKGKGPQGPPPIQPKEEELAKVREKTTQIESLVAELKKKPADAVLLNDVEVY